MKYPFVYYIKTLDGLFCLCCIFFPTSAHQGQRAQNLITVLYKTWRKALEDLDKHATLSCHLTSMTKIQSFLQTMEIPSSRIDNNISSNEVNSIKENREYLTAILRALHQLDHQGFALRGKYDDGNPTNEDVIDKGNFKELLNVMCESNDRLRELFEKR